MRTPAEKHLVETLVSLLSSREGDAEMRRILNAGAGRSTSIEDQLTRAGCQYVCDRLDVEECHVDSPVVGECWQCSIEDMRPVGSGRYAAVFSNFVLEHVEDIRAASREVHRTLAPGGIFVLTVPNTSAPEFVVAKHTPVWFHEMVRGAHAWETHYTYDGIPELLDLLLDAGFSKEAEEYWPAVEGYLVDRAFLRRLGGLYDRAVAACKLRRFMGQACLVVRKPAESDVR